MRIKLACADFTFPLLKHKDALALIKMLGINAVDIGLFEDRSHLQPSDQFRSVGRSARTLKRNLDDLGLKAADIFLQVANDAVSHAINHPLASRRRKASDWYRRTLNYTCACDSKHVTITPGVFFNGTSKSDDFKKCCDELAWRVEAAQEQGITLGVEAHVGSIAPTPRAAERLVRSVPGLTLTLDYTHFTRIGMKDKDVEPLVQHASHFHVRGGRKGRLQASFKDNVIDYGRILKVMKKTGYRGYVGLEYVWTEWENCNEVDNLSETILYRDFIVRAARKLGK